MTRLNETSRPDLYTRVTNTIIADLENGVRPWTKPWSAEHLAGRIRQRLRSRAADLEDVLEAGQHARPDRERVDREQSAHDAGLVGGEEVGEAGV